MIKRHAKTNPIRSVIMSIPPSLTGGAFFYGKIKSGKTCAMMALAQKYKDNPNMNYKIIDLFGGYRKENLYWALPSVDHEYWERVRKVLNIDIKQELPKQYKVNLLYPFFASLLPNQLPSDAPNVKSKIFTIPFKDVVSDDIKLVINNMSQQAQYTWREALLQIKKTDGGAKLNDVLIKFQAENINLYRNFAMPLAKEGLLQSEDCDYNLDILAELKDMETISVLCLDFIPPVYHLFIMGWILRKTTELIDSGKIRTKNIFILREASEFFKATDNSISEDRIKFFRSLMSNYIRYGRRGMHTFLDTQSPSETKGLVEGSMLGNTLVKTDKGDQKIEKIKFTKVFSYDFKNNKFKINKARQVFSGIKECYKIELENDKSVIATGEHKFFDKNKKKIKVKNLKVNDEVVFIE